MEVGPAVRSVALVQAALKDAPGLGALTPAEIDSLAAQLSQGVCVDRALQEATGKINRHTLASLLRHMNLCPSTEPGSY